MFSKKELNVFAGELASREPVPGGGGASAYVGALGAALGTMAAELTCGKKKYLHHTSELEDIIRRLNELRHELISLVDGDAEAFAPLARIYAIPHGTPGREEQMEVCLRRAADAPMQIVRCCCRCIELLAELTDICAPLAVSDAATGVVLCRAALLGGAVNVRVNTHYMRDRDYAAALDQETVQLAEKYGRLTDDLYDKIWKML